MASITTRAGKGAPLSWNEADANFTNLNNDKIEAASPSTLTNKTVNLTSNTLTGTKAQFDTACSDDNFAYVGQANTFTQGQTISSGNLSLSGTGQRITGDFSNATPANRVLFQTSTVNGSTSIGAVPHGSGAAAQFTVFSYPDTANTQSLTLQADNTAGAVKVMSNASGTAPYVPMLFYTGGSERIRIDANGNVGIGQTPARKLDVAGGARFIQDTAPTSGAIIIRQNTGDTVGGFIQWVNNDNSAEKGWVYMDTTSNLIFGPGSSEKFRFGSSGQLGIGGENYGTAGQVLTSNGSGSAPSWSSVSSSGTAKAWCNFDGRLTGTNAPRSGSNVTSVTRNGIGDYTINFTSALANANYAASFSCPNRTDVTVAVVMEYSTDGSTPATKTTTSFRIVVRAASNNTGMDTGDINVIIFGG